MNKLEENWKKLLWVGKCIYFKKTQSLPPTPKCDLPIFLRGHTEVKLSPVFYIHVRSFIHPKQYMLIIKICKIQTPEIYCIYTTEISNSRQQLWEWLVESQKWLPTVNESTTHLNCARHVAGWLILWYGPSAILSCEKVTVHTLMTIKNRHIDKKTW